jgi:hypothetical protein
MYHEEFRPWLVGSRLRCGGSIARMGLSVAGGVGVILYSSILSMSIYQTALYLGDSRADKSSRQYQLKLYFHIVFGFYCLFDLLYYVSLYFYATYVTWGYALHLISLLINLYAFSIVIYLWRITLDPRDIRIREQVAGFLFLGINTISTCCDLVLWCKFFQPLPSSPYSGTHPKKDLNDPETVAINLVYVSSILFVTCSLIVLGHQLKHRLSQSSSTRSPQRTQNEIQIKTMAILRRTNTVLVICAVCYGIRTLFLLILTLDSVGNTSPGGAVLGMPNIMWFTLTSWIPTLFPVRSHVFLQRFISVGCHLPLHHEVPTSPQSEEKGVSWPITRKREPGR